MKRILGTLTIALIVSTLSLAETASAQHTAPVHDVQWWTQVVQQHTHSLQSPNNIVRANTLRQLTRLADTYGHRVDFKPAVAPLLEIYAHDTRKRNRLRALAALQAMRDDSAMSRLATLVEAEASPRVRARTQDALRAFGTVSAQAPY